MVRKAIISHAMKATALGVSARTDQFATIIFFCCLSFAGWVCIWFRRRRRQQEADDFAAAVQLSLNERASSGGSSDRDVVSGRSAPDASTESSADQVVDIAEIKQQKGLLSTATIFQMKRNWLNKELGRAAGAKGDKRVVKIAVRRDKVVQDSIAQMLHSMLGGGRWCVQFARMKAEARLLPLAVSFIGEAGRDDGGVTRDWYSALSRELVAPAHGLFTLTDSNSKAYDLNANCPATLEVFRFVGLVVGRGIRDSCLLDVPLSPLIYKRILDIPLGLEDMASLDAQVHQNLCWLLAKDLGEGDLGLTFSFSQERGGEHVDVELKVGGSCLPVCESNKSEFVDLLVDHRLRSSVAAQTLALKEGVAEMVDPTLLHHFDEKELELLVEGLPLIDPVEWRIHTVYGAGYFDDLNCLPVTWFWHIVDAWDQDMRARLLQFVTGSSKVPFPEGFMGLRGSDGPRRFHIVRVSDDTRLPQAHTCFNELILPDYESMEELSHKLVTAIFDSGNQFQLR